MNRLLFVFLLTLMIGSCGKKEVITEEKYPEEEKIKEVFVKLSKEEIKTELDKNKIIFSELVVDTYFDKVVLRVILKEKMNESDLKEYSIELKNKYLFGYEKIYIFYDLNKNDYIGWAHCHFRPNMEFSILGSTLEQDLKLQEISNNENINGDLIGKWKNDMSLMGAIITLVKREDIIYYIINFKDGGKIEEKVSIKTVKGKIQYKINDFGEYYVIEKNGNLGMYGENGKFDEAIKIN